ncbi:hypothetical protein IFM89_009760 [Coptis chinensis]|uniref:Amidase domain-containing protein n=1 Tax=Coptis chinensis TaxID=261450 RepID=A0A835LZ22_9MAGN|nr:hypothetical protein IFM89_009760 [Coptis chinensis]
MGMFKSKLVVYEPIEDVDLSPDGGKTYLRANVQAPRMTGALIRIFVWVLELRFFGPMMVRLLIKMNLINKLITDVELKEPPTYVPTHPWEDVEKKDVLSIEHGLSPPEQVQQAVSCLPACTEKNEDTQTRFHRWTIQDYSRAYISGETTPLLVIHLAHIYLVAAQFLASVQESSRPPIQMSFFINYNSEDILQQATESTLRYGKGAPISILDGVPIAVKDEIDCMPYPTTGGTKWLHKLRPCIADACCVKLLRSCGAMIVGKTNMHELGAGTSGINPHYGAARNPYDTNRITGGSSSGSAAVVSAGLCPAALGVDGGGSVRMPAALCGVVGLKPTFERVSHSGVNLFDFQSSSHELDSWNGWNIIRHSGRRTHCVEFFSPTSLFEGYIVQSVTLLIKNAEIILFVLSRYAAISGNLPSNQPTSLLPKVEFPLLKSADSIFNFKMAKYDELSSPFYVFHVVTVLFSKTDVCFSLSWFKWFSDCSEDIKKCCSQALYQLCEHYAWETVELTIPEIEVMRLAHYLTIGSECTAALGSHLQKLDTKEIGCDVRAALTFYNGFTSKEYLNAQRMSVTAYSITEDALKCGELDYINGAALVRYMVSGNFLGLPAITVPVGYDKLGMPIGIQFIGRPWSESTLIRIAFMMQSLCMSRYKKPKVFYDLLRKE